MSKYFNIWPTISQLAKEYGVEYVTAGSWVSRDEIPAKYDARTLHIIAEHGFDVSIDALFRWHQQHREFRAAMRKGKSVAVPSVPFVKNKREKGVDEQGQISAAMECPGKNVGVKL